MEELGAIEDEKLSLATKALHDIVQLSGEGVQSLNMRQIATVADGKLEDLQKGRINDYA